MCFGSMRRKGVGNEAIALVAAALGISTRAIAVIRGLAFDQVDATGSSSRVSCQRARRAIRPSRHFRLRERPLACAVFATKRKQELTQ